MLDMRKAKFITNIVLAATVLVTAAAAIGALVLSCVELARSVD